MTFEWASAAAKPQADQLRNSVLKVSLSGKSHQLALRKPRMVPAVTVDLKDRTTTILPGETLPEAESLFVEVLELEAKGVEFDASPHAAGGGTSARLAKGRLAS